MERAVLEQRTFAILFCYAALMLLMLVGLVGCLLFWLGAKSMKCKRRNEHHWMTILQARIHSLILRFLQQQVRRLGC